MKRAFRPIRQSLSLKLSLWVLLYAVVLFSVCLCAIFIRSRRVVKDAAIERASSVLNTIALRVNGYMSEIETASNNFVWLAEQNMQPDSLMGYTRRVVELNPHVNGCSITTEPYYFEHFGRYFSVYTVRQRDSVQTVKEGVYEYYEKVWYKTPKMLGRACWVDPFDDYNEGTLSSEEVIASYCIPLRNGKGDFIGVLSTDLSLGWLSKTITAERPYEHSYCMMVGKDGHFYVHPDENKLFKETIFSGIDPQTHPDIIALGHEMLNGKSGSLSVVLDGKPCLVFYRPVPHTRWSIALVCMESDIFSIYNQLALVLLPIIVIGLIIILLFCWQAVKYFIRPLHILLHTLHRIGDGRFDEQIPHTKRKDSIGQLQDSFATMQESLAAHFSSLQQMSAEMEQRNKELVEANKMVEESRRMKMAFVQNMTHQVRTPLNIVLGFAQVMRDNYGVMSEEETASLIKEMARNSVSITRMVLMLFDSSSTGSAGMLTRNEFVSCNEMARECIENTKLQYPQIEIKLDTALPDTFCVLTDRLYFFRCLRELLYNAAKFSNGKVVNLYVREAETMVVIVVEDVGPGISVENRERMFDPFAKMDDFTEGLGLGLPLTKRHAKNLGGDLELDTDYLLGCRFVLKLPKE